MPRGRYSLGEFTGVGEEGGGGAPFKEAQLDPEPVVTYSWTSGLFVGDIAWGVIGLVILAVMFVSLGVRRKIYFFSTRILSAKKKQ